MPRVWAFGRLAALSFWSRATLRHLGRVGLAKSRIGRALCPIFAPSLMPRFLRTADYDQMNERDGAGGSATSDGGEGNRAPASPRPLPDIGMRTRRSASARTNLWEMLEQGARRPSTRFSLAVAQSAFSDSVDVRSNRAFTPYASSLAMQRLPMAASVP